MASFVAEKRARQRMCRLWPTNDHLDRMAIAVALLGGWELYGTFAITSWISQPTAILSRLITLFGGRLPNDVATTLSEIGLGFLFGMPPGVIFGLWLGRSETVATLFKPFIMALNSIPVVALAPLLIMWFGLGLAPKVALVTLVVFFLVFFNTFSGAKSVDQDSIESLQLMGATPFECFRLVIAPASLAWILAGLRAALPYSLIAAIVGELMLSREGVGNYIASSAAQFDLVGVYAGLFTLMILGALFSEACRWLEGVMLRWRQ